MTFSNLANNKLNTRQYVIIQVKVSIRVGFSYKYFYLQQINLIRTMFAKYKNIIIYMSSLRVHIPTLALNYTSIFKRYTDFDETYN
jgi:hypothetical protein